MNNKALHKLSYGLFVLTAQDENGRTTGCIINTAIQAASDPNTVTICVNKANYTHDVILKTNKFNVCMLSEKADFGLFQHFGFQSGRDIDKFADFKDYKLAGNGLPIITRGTNAYISGWVTQTVDLGSHTLFIALVADMDVLDEAAPSCTYTYYFENIKPKPAAPKEDGKVTWVCTICGYVYEGDPIPDDFICPLCKHPASDFERVVG
ncbi:MAG: flavin reductase [Clostridia bacterium]|nr:flavin reductase [Clostridia bacterium]